MSDDRICAEDSFAAEAEKSAFGRERKTGEAFGVYRKLAVSQAGNKKVSQICQDGGAVTSILLSAMQNGATDAALVMSVHPEKHFFPVPKLATTPREILEAAGSKYVCSQSPLALIADAEKQGKTKVALVGLPCQIRTFRRLQIANPSKVACVKLSLGLMCSGCFSYEMITDFVQKKLSINLQSITKMNIKKKMLIATNEGVVSVALSEISPYKQKCWDSCFDFSSELADVSFGGLGLDGWTFVVIRSEKGEEMFRNAEKAGLLQTRSVSSDDDSVKLLTRLSRKKLKH